MIRDPHTGNDLITARTFLFAIFAGAGMYAFVATLFVIG